MNVNQAIGLAFNHYEEGYLKEAKLFCERILEIQQENADKTRHRGKRS